MNRIKNFALKRPFLFGLALIVVFALLSVLTYPVHFLFPDSGPGPPVGQGLGELIIFLIFVWVLWKLGWLKASGLTNLGKVQTWLAVLLILVYLAIVEVYAFTGDLSFSVSDWPMAAATLLDNLGTGFVEEIMFRGLVLVAMVIAWGNTKKGLVKAILLSSLFFGVMHLFNIFIRPPGVVILQALIVSLPGILYAALTLSSRSIWPAIIIHWLTNAAVNVKLLGYPNFEESFSMWLIFVIGLLPVLAYAAYLIWKLPERFEYEGLEPVKR
jgi:membrane protease YdiL (CAAX protease family)